MTRERTTWNRDEIKRVAAMPKQADPYLMNQDHVSQNPRADKYMNGTPSSWAEDVHSPNEWESEYANGQTKRNEVGEPEFRSETFNHPEKTASNQLLIKKADLTVKVARLMLGPKVAENLVEDQAVALMALPDSDLIETFQRLAQDQEQQQGQGQGGDQQPQAAQQLEEEVQQEPAQDQQQQAGMQQQALQQQCIQAIQQGDMPAAMAAMQQMQQQGGQAEFPGGQWGKNNPVAASAKKPPVKKAQQGQGQGQEQQEPPAQQQQAAVPPVAGQQDQDQQQQQAGMQQQALQQQIQALQEQIQQMQAQQQGQGGMPEGMQQEPVLAHEDALLDEMLAPAGGGADMGGIGEIELEPASMDVGEIEMGPQDDVLKTLFANQETQDAEQAQQLQSGQQQPVQNFNTVVPSGPYAPHAVQANVLRSPSSRTVGTRPTVGVSRVGGASVPAMKTASSDIDKLSNLWSTAPDVREHFGLK